MALKGVFRQLAASMPVDLRLAAILAVAISANFVAVRCGSACPAAIETWRALWKSFVAGGAGLLCISLGFTVLPSRGRWRHAALAVVGLLATCALSLVWMWIGPLSYAGHDAAPIDDVNLLWFWQTNFGLTALLVLQRACAERRRLADESLHAVEMRRIAANAETSQAHLGLLEAQIEPHFLFNALANVRRLLRTDSVAARRMIADLLRYLEEALPRLRDPRSTLAREAELVRAFLAVQCVRMGGRLRVELDIPPGLMHCELPSMSLLTLVENALKHGLQPMVGGGTIRVAAQATDGGLELSVADDGHGMGGGMGHGMGLVNLRARLKALHGAAASLSLRVNEPRGVVATILLPREGP